MSPLSIYIYKPDIDFFWTCNMTRITDGRRLDASYMPLLNFQTGAYLENPYFKVVSNPAEADFFFIPKDVSRYLDLWMLGHQEEYQGSDPIGRALTRLESEIQGLAHYEKAPERHVFFCNHDHWRPLALPSIFFPSSVHRDHLGPNIFPFPYGNEPMNGLLAPDFSSIPQKAEPDVDFSFVGSISLPIRRRMINSMIDRDPDIGFFYTGRETFWGANQDQEEVTDYIASLVFSRSVLCPRGAGLNSRRFFEVISAGRVPVLLSQPLGLPFSDVIDYSAFTIFIDVSHVDHLAEVLKRWIQRFGRARLQKMGNLALQAHVDHLHIRHWPRHIHRHLSSCI